MYLCITDLAERSRNSFQDIVLVSVMRCFVFSAAEFFFFFLGFDSEDSMLFSSC